MSTTSETTCDLCGVVKPDDYKRYIGWAYIRIAGAEEAKDYCPTCWRPVGKILLRSFVDSIMLEAMGVKEEEE